MQLRPRDWFTHVMGHPESKWDFTTLPAGLNTGEFSTPSLHELKQVLANLPQRRLPDLHIITRSQYVDPHRFDTSALQLRHPHALIQVASNFNCLELGSDLANEFSGKYLTGLMTDTTQGPSAAAGAGLGAIKRLAIHRANPINLLSDVPLPAPKGKLYRLGREPINADAIRIGLHVDVRATFDRSQGCLYYPDGPLIDQVFTSTFIVGKKPSPAELDLTRTLLEAAYVGTYLAAILRRSPSLILTLIGGGAFNNPPSMIIEALSQAHRQYGPYLAKGCEVKLPIYEPNPVCYLELIKRYLPDAKLTQL